MPMLPSFLDLEQPPARLRMCAAGSHGFAPVHLHTYTRNATGTGGTRPHARGDQRGAECGRGGSDGAHHTIRARGARGTRGVLTMPRPCEMRTCTHACACVQCTGACTCTHVQCCTCTCLHVRAHPVHVCVGMRACMCMCSWSMPRCRGVDVALCSLGYDPVYSRLQPRVAVRR